MQASQSGGGVSIIQLLPSQPSSNSKVIQSVIQPAISNNANTSPATITATVIGAPAATANHHQQPHQQTSVIQATGGVVNSQTLISSRADEEALLAASNSDEEQRKRRDVLARRPSYRKILNELSSADLSAITSLHSSATATAAIVTGATNSAAAVLAAEVKSESSASDAETGPPETTTITVGGTHYLKVLPASIQLSGSGQPADAGGQLSGIHTLTNVMTNAGGAGPTGAIVRYTQGQEGQIFVPVTVSAADLQAYSMRTNAGLSPGVLTATGPPSQPGAAMGHGGHVPGEEQSKKRELRLLKNREAAKECRRKKKEYIKCLENRVAVLENQNKALIEELKSLKELYCQKAD